MYSLIGHLEYIIMDSDEYVGYMQEHVGTEIQDLDTPARI